MPLHEIAFWSAVFFIAGVFAASISANTFIFTISVLSVTAFVATWGVLSVKTRALWFSGLVLLALLGFFYYQWDEDNFAETNLPTGKGNETAFKGVVIRDPKHFDDYQQLVAELQTPHQGTILIKTERYPQFEYGDLLEFKGRITEPQPYGYKQYLAKERINGVSYYPKIKRIASGRGSPARGVLFGIKNSIISVFEKTLPAEKAALLAGLTLGEQAGFGTDFKEAMRKSGTLHLIALSGYNISILAWAIAGTLGRFMKQRATFIATVLVISGFVIMTGAEASVVRAGIMGILILIARQAGKIYSFKNALALTAFSMILANPKILVFDIGFQLSFAALMGIVYLKPAAERLLFKNPEPGLFNWKDNLFTTAAAQTAVLPILLLNFNNFSLISLLSNVLILETVPLTMFLGFILGAAGLINGYLAIILSWLANVFLAYQTFIIRISSGLSGYLSVDFGVSLAVFLVYYLCLGAFIIFAYKYAKR